MVDMAQLSKFAARLRELRIRAGLTQAQLGKKSGIPTGSIINWENDKREPKWSAVVILANALGVDVLAFTTEPESTEPPGMGRPAHEDE